MARSRFVALIAFLCVGGCDAYDYELEDIGSTEQELYLIGTK